MTNLLNTANLANLADYTQELFEQMPEVAGNERDHEVSGNLITITFGSEFGDFPISVAVSFDDTAESIHERFVALLSEHLDDIDSMIKWEDDNYEHASHTQGYAFDSLTLSKF